MQPPLSPTAAHATLDQSPLALTPEPLPYTSPLFLCSIPAGFPSPATDYIEDGLDLNEYLVRHKAASFMFKVQGHSMRDAGIVDGDKVVVDRSIEPQHNQIVIAVVDGEFTCKRLYKRAGRIRLIAENPEFPAMDFSDGQELQIWGVVTNVIHRMSP